GRPTIKDPTLKAQQIFTGLDHPTSMAFLGPNDILVLEKNTGTVQRIVNGRMLPQPLLHVKVGQEVEWGMLGIAVAKHNDITYVFLYYTEPESNNNNSGEQGAEAGGVTGEGNTQSQSMVNHLYRYELVDNQLINPKLLLILPATSPDPVPPGENNHVGGKVVIGPDSNVYVGIGDVGGHAGQAQNVKDGIPLDGTSGILRVTQDGDAVVSPNSSPLGNDTDPTLNKYYAYGIRNTFGMDFDPVTGKLWDTENGAFCCDEINLVEPGFNSGWQQVQGIWQVHGSSLGPIFQSPDNLVDFGGNGKYRSPEFTWLQTDGPTALKFLNSDKLGKQYEDSMFVGDVNTGNLFNFKLDEERTGLDLAGPLSDKVANTPEELQDNNIFGSGFGVITDIQVGPDDGYLYVLTYGGTIYRIAPSS
ncbi:MAG TPA: PQQ-dependent sugar dehydrogenase, partial [Saprospiraceae bacterium]|nr:PQQ-dependent sugar dehydrogenase [Saprospiraceae bacterium]